MDGNALRLTLLFVNNSFKLTQIKKLGKMLPIIAQTLKVKKHRICVYKNVSCIKNSVSLTLIPAKKRFLSYNTNPKNK